MPRHHCRAIGRLLLVVLSTAAASWACSAQARTARHTDRADGFFDQKKYKEAILEYRNVLESDPQNARALQRLGVAHFELREMGQAYSYLVRASQSDPDNLEVRSRLGIVQALSRRPDEARANAEFVLQKDPANLEGLAILAEVAESDAEVDAAIARVESVRSRVSEPHRASHLLGLLYAKKGDLPKAEAALQEAVKAAPASVEAHTALAQLHLARHQPDLAEKEFAAAAQAAPAGSPARLRLADFYLAQKKLGQVRQVLTEVLKQDPDYTPAAVRLAELALLEKKYDDAETAIEGILKANPRHTGALLLRAQLRMVQRRTDEAIQALQTAIREEPKSPPAHYQLALAHLQAGHDALARTSLREAVTLSPGFAEAVLRLAQMNLDANAPGPAIDDLQKLLRVRPGLPRAYELLGAAYLKQGDKAKAAEAYQSFQKMVPAADPRGSYYAAVALRAQGRRAEARKAFEDALAKAPGAPDPLQQLVNMAFEDKRPDDALAVARQQVKAAPRSPAVHHVLGQVHQRRGEAAPAEAAHLQAVQLDPRYVPSRLELARIYLASGRPNQAVARLDEARRLDPGNAEAWLLTGAAREQKGEVPQAQEAFKKALELNPRLAGAANNLAWLYSEHGGDAEEALRLAQLAKEVAPDDPHVSDTLGWVLYKRGVYQRALGLLRESAARLPDSAQVHYHLGMTHYKLGDRPAARQALSRALELGAGFPGADEARKVLAEL
jgi:tetratricopeptide (TPR) repeat protein